MKRFYFTTRVLYQIEGTPPFIHEIHQGGGFSTEKSWKSGLSRLKKAYRESEEKSLVDVLVHDSWATSGADPLVVKVMPEIEFHFDRETDRFVIDKMPSKEVLENG